MFHLYLKPLFQLLFLLLLDDLKIFDVFDSKIIDSSLENKMSMFSILENIERPVIILTIIIIIVGVFGTRILRN